MSSQIIGQVIRLIRDGALTDGDRLPPERELANTFGVSRVTVRDALRALEVMGLLEIRVGASGGAFVTTPSPEVVGESIANILMMRSFEVEQIVEARVALELGIFAVAAQRVTSDDLARLREICQESRQRFEAGDYDTKLSFQFHHALAGAAHNPAISMLAESFSGPLSMAAMRAKEVRDDARRRTVEEHEALVDALEAGDIRAGRKVLASHLLRGHPIEDAVAGLIDPE